MLNIKLGCDPELFMQDGEGHLKSSIGLIGGSKYAPMPLPLGDGYAVQEDNVAVEFNIPPAEKVQDFVQHIQATLDLLSGHIKEKYNYKFSQLSAAEFPKEELQHPAALEFGCDPDFNAWTLKQNPRPRASNKALRSCGGHVHVGYKGKAEQEEIIKCMDLYLGVPSILMDKGDLRKNLYGKRGAFRPKSYGPEYRTLSNFWIFSPQLIEWVWRNTERAVTAAEAQFNVNEYDDAILQAIDYNNKDAAKYLVNKLNLEVVNV